MVSRNATYRSQLQERRWYARITMWLWNRKPAMDGFPKDFRVQPIFSSAAIEVADRPHAEVAKYFRDNPRTAKALLEESYDKRYSPSTFLTEEVDTFSVGWFTRGAERQCVREFTDLADAATDYLLFSLGKGRWTPETPESRGLQGKG